MERGAADYVGGKVHTVGQVDLVDEVDFLGALGNEKAHPFGKLRVLVCELAVEEDDSTEGPRVILENSCNCGGARVLGEVSIAQDERGRAPDVAPASGEGGGAGSVRDGEAGDDDTEEVIVEGANAVLPTVDGVGEGGEAVVAGGSEGGEAVTHGGEVIVSKWRSEATVLSGAARLAGHQPFYFFSFSCFDTSDPVHTGLECPV